MNADWIDFNRWNKGFSLRSINGFLLNKQGLDSWFRTENLLHNIFFKIEELRKIKNFRRFMKNVEIKELENYYKSESIIIRNRRLKVHYKIITAFSVNANPFFAHILFQTDWNQVMKSNKINKFIILKFIRKASIDLRKIYDAIDSFINNKTGPIITKNYCSLGFEVAGLEYRFPSNMNENPIEKKKIITEEAILGYLNRKKYDTLYNGGNI